MKKIFTKFFLFTLLIALNAIAATFGGAVGCGGGGDDSSGRKVLVDVQYPEGMQDLASGLIVEGTLYKTSTASDSSKAAGPVKGISDGDTSFEFTFANDLQDGTYYLKILFKGGSSPSDSLVSASLKSMVLAKSGSASSSAQSECLCILTAQERCEQQLWAVVGSSCGGQEEKCKQSIEEGCANDSSDFECKPEENKNCDDSSAVSSQDASTNGENTVATYQESSAPILASIMAQVILSKDQDASLSIPAGNFDLSYDDDGDGITNFDEVVGINIQGDPTLPTDTLDVQKTIHYSTIKATTAQYVGAKSPYVISDCYKLSSVSCPNDKDVETEFKSQVGQVGTCFEQKNGAIYAHQIEWKYPVTVSSDKKQISFFFRIIHDDGSFSQFDMTSQAISSNAVQDQKTFTIDYSEKDECGKALVSAQCSFGFKYESGSYMETYDTIFNEPAFYADSCKEQSYCGDGVCAADEDGTNCTKDCANTEPIPLTEPPSKITIFPGDKQNTLEWEKVENETYNIYWSLSPNVTIKDGTKIENVKSPYVHLNLVNGTTYYYVMTSINASGESVGSTINYQTPSDIYYNDWLLVNESSPSLLGYANGKIFGVDNHKIINSLDGKYWTSGVSVPVSSNLSKIVYANNLYVVVGSSGTIITSPDGEIWTVRQLGKSYDLNGIIYANNKFVTVGSNGTVLTSFDGITWQSQNSGISRNLRAVTYGNGLFVAVGQYYIDGYAFVHATIIVSSDGISWSNKSVSISKLADLLDVQFIGNLFIAVGQEGMIYSSFDTLSWSSGNSGVISSLNSVTYGDGVIMIVGDDGVVLGSANAATWIPLYWNKGNCLYDILYANNLFIAFGEGITIASE